MKTFDVFAGTEKDKAIWRCSVQGEAEAVFIMKKLADEKPGPYFVFDVEYAQIVAVVAGRPSPKPESNPKRKSTAA